MVTKKSTKRRPATRLPKNGVLKRLRRYWPQVETVSDATENVMIGVVDEDRAIGKRRDHASCALARACVREGIADAALIGRGTSYLIKGTHAIRYKTPESVAREVVTFDRHGDFAPGQDYHLAKISPGARFGERQGRSRGRDDGSRPRAHKVVHQTVRVRESV